MAERSLPIWQLHAGIVGHLKTGNRLVLVAPTGSGKTTQVPQMLLDAGFADLAPVGRASPRAVNSPSAGERDQPEIRARGDARPPGKKIVVLQPRRVAARTVAARVAWERGCKLGEEVGYQIRFDDQTSLGTRICYVTEGILLRWLQDDRTLPDVGVILFDEFHERNLFSDVALALVKQLQQTQRPDLKMMVMSATLDAEPVADYLALGVPASAGKDNGPSRSVRDGTPNRACPILISEGVSFPVEVRYLDHQDERPITEQAADGVEGIINAGEPGDILVFMPGMGEINATINALRAARLNERVAFVPLHGDLPPEEQDLAFAQNPLRKVVVATNVAETSVTIDGIRHVVDSGQARVARYDVERGIGTLFLEDISRASTDQRKGRAGRTAPGMCHRLWTESGQLNRPERNTPEIQRSDLAEVVLLLHSLGIQRAAGFDWLDKPDPLAVERAEKLLQTLGALKSGGTTPDTLIPLTPSLSPSDGEREKTAGARRHLADRSAEAARSVLSPIPLRGGEGQGEREASHKTSSSDLTPIGRLMLRLPMHPRYSRMLVEASRRGCTPAAALCAALVSGRDLLQRVRREDQHIAEARELFEASQDSDFFTLMRAYQFAKNSNFSVERCRRYGINAQVARQVEQTFGQILQIAQQQKLVPGRASREEGEEPSTTHDQRPKPEEDALLRCITAGFIDQLCLRRDQGTLECDLTEGRHGTLMRESVVQSAPLFVAATVREVTGRSSSRPGGITLLGLATAVKREWLEEMFPDQLSARVEHLFDRTHKRVAAVKLVRFHDLVIHHEHQSEVVPAAAGRSLADAYRKGWFELPLFNHDLKQFIARVNLVCAARPVLEFPRFDEAAIAACLARAFAGLTLVKEAQATHLKESFAAHLAPEQVGWLDELAPTAVPWPGDRKVKLLYADDTDAAKSEVISPEAQVKLLECFELSEHPRVCERATPVKLWLCAPDGKRLESTVDWPAWKATQYPKLKSALLKKYPGFTWR